MPNSEQLEAVYFDGSNWETLTRLSTQSFLVRLTDGEIDSDIDQCAWLAQRFRGPALDWVGQRLANTPPATLFAGYDAFLEEVRNNFGISDGGLNARRRGQLEDLKWDHNDLPVFFAEFDRLTQSLSIAGDDAKISLLRHKLPNSVQKLLAEQALDFHDYATMRERLLTMWALDPHRNTAVTSGSSSAPRKRPRCGRCSKRGHTAADCRAAKN